MYIVMSDSLASCRAASAFFVVLMVKMKTMMLKGHLNKHWSQWTDTGRHERDYLSSPSSRPWSSSSSAIMCQWCGHNKTTVSQWSIGRYADGEEEKNSCPAIIHLRRLCNWGTKSMPRYTNATTRVESPRGKGRIDGHLFREHIHRRRRRRPIGHGEGLPNQWKEKRLCGDNFLFAKSETFLRFDFDGILKVATNKPTSHQHSDCVNELNLMGRAAIQRGSNQ